MCGVVPGGTYGIEQVLERRRRALILLREFDLIE
jgi:hypothetical protein